MYSKLGFWNGRIRAIVSENIMFKNSLSKLTIMSPVHIKFSQNKLAYVGDFGYTKRELFPSR